MLGLFNAGNMSLEWSGPAASLGKGNTPEPCKEGQRPANDACGQIGETVAFDRAIGVALDYQEDHPDTLVVVTADHSHTSQIVGEGATGTGLPTGYGTAGYQPGAAAAAVPPSQQHTGAVVPVWASGPGGLAVLGTNDHTGLFDVLGQ